MPQSPLPVAVIGAAGYTGGEAIELLLRHPQFCLAAAVSESQAGTPIYATHPRLRGLPGADAAFAKTLDGVTAEAWILCVGHGRAASLLVETPPPPGVKVVDLSTDFRANGDHGFVYGLPEAFAKTIADADRVANPGCFATAIQLALLPLAQAGLLQNPMSVTAITGSTGAGQALSPTGHFSWRADNLSAYKTFEHQHLAEIRQTLGQVAGISDSTLPPIHFVPVRGDFTRGIFSVAQLPISLSQKQVDELYQDFYSGQRRSFYSTENPDLQQVVRTNNAIIHAHVQGGQLALISIIDNLGKGASGQAIENLELMFGLA